MEPLVSILIPAFNAEPWIAETIESAVAQTWPRKEIIVVDDGSTDGTVKIARQFASKSVSVLSQENQGAAAARNKAFSISKGDYIQWLDADDLLSEDKVRKQMEAIKVWPGKRTLFSCAWGHFIFRSSKANFVPTALWGNLSPVEWLLRKMGQNLYMQPATWLVSRELTEAVGPWDTRLLGDDDGEYFCRVLLASDGVRFVPDAKVFYRKAVGGSLSYIGRSSKKQEAQLVSMQLHIRYLLSLEDSERARAACLKYLQNWLIFFYPERPDLARRLEGIAASLGRQLAPPKLPWRYVCIEKLFGQTVAKRVKLGYNRCRASVNAAWDKALYRIEKRRSKSVPRMRASDDIGMPA